MKIEFKVLGDPKGKARARTVRKGKHSHSFTPKETEAYEQKVVTAYRIASKGFSWEKGIPIAIKIMAWYRMPKRVNKKRLEDMLSGKEFPMKTPDLDNIAKIVCDALNGVAYHDDAQVVYLVVCKKWAKEPYVYVSIEEIEV